MNPFAVEIPQYEGPLDLLLSIVRRNELSIHDLPLAPITAQYLAYIQEAETLDVNLGMEWLEMAARLIQWKASSLLPADPALPDLAAGLARELGSELQALSDSQLRQAKEFLEERNEATERTWSAERLRERPAAAEEPVASLWTLRQKAQALSDRFQQRRRQAGVPLDLDLASPSVDEMKMVALQELEAVSPGMWFSAAPWFSSATTLERKTYLFLALLDLAADGAVRIGQDTVESSVRLCRT